MTYARIARHIESGDCYVWVEKAYPGRNNKGWVDVHKRPVDHASILHEQGATATPPLYVCFSVTREEYEMLYWEQCAREALRA